jgi:hypothetical protein
MAQVKDASLKPLGYQKINPTAATGLTPPTGARYALIKCEAFPVMWRDDGTNPTTTDGMPLEIGDEFWYAGNLNTIKLIDDGGASTVHVSYYR